LSDIASKSKGLEKLPVIGYRVHPASQSVCSGTRRHKQQQLRECPTDLGHCKADQSTGSVGWLGTRLRKPQATRTTAQEWHCFHWFVLDFLL